MTEITSKAECDLDHRFRDPVGGIFSPEPTAKAVRLQDHSTKSGKSTVTASPSDLHSLHLSSYQPFREGQTLVAWMGDGTAPLLWHLLSLSHGEGHGSGIQDLSPLGAQSTAQWIARPGKWRLMATSPSREIRASLEFWIHPADQAPRLAQEIAQAEDPHSVQGGLSRVRELLESFPQESDDLAARKFKESLQEQQSRLEAVIQAVAGEQRYPLWCEDPSQRAFVSVGPQGWQLVDWSDAALAAGTSCALEPVSTDARQAVPRLLEQWKATSLRGRARGGLAFPEQPNDPATAWVVHSFDLVGTAGGSQPTAVDVGIWHGALSRAMAGVEPLVPARMGASLGKIEGGLGLWRRGSAKLDLFCQLFQGSEGILDALGFGSNHPLSRGALVEGSGKDAGKSYRCWTRKEGKSLEILLVELDQEKALKSLLEGRGLPTPDRFSWFLAEIGTALRTRKILWYQHEMDGGDVEDWLQDDDKRLTTAQLSSVAGHTKHRTHRVVVGFWPTGFQTETEHPEIRPLVEPSNGKGHVAIRLLDDWGEPLASRSVKILREGALVHEVALKDGCASQGDLPYGCYELEVDHEGHIHRFSAAWLPGQPRDAIQTCHLTHPVPRA